MLYRLSSRSFGRIALQCFLCLVCFLIGYRYNGSSPGCIHKLDPHHENHPELLEGFHGLKQKSSFLIIAIISSPRHFEQRSIIRETWLNVPDRKVRSEFQHYFVVGSQDLPDDVDAQLQDENLAHKDLLLLPMLDSYPTLTKKVLNTFVLLNRNIDFKYLLKVDDDSYVRIPEVLDELHHTNYEKALYWGFFDGRAPVQKTGKWQETNFVLCDRYLPYALGGGYVLSHDLISFVADNSDKLQMYKSEDISVGTWLAPLKVNRVHDTRFDTEFRSRGCSNKYLLSHKQSVQDMRSKHYSMTSAGVLCEKEVQVRTSYKYDWTVLPSKCCVRDDSTLP